MKVIFDHTEPVAKNITSFWFKPDRAVRYIAGQFIELRIPHDNKDSRGDKRWFTLSSSPTDKLLSITTKHATENGSSFKEALHSLKPGTQLDMASPMGDFILPKDASIPLLFVAGGIGCTPFHSIIKFLQDTSEQRNITMLHAVHEEAELPFKETFNKLGDKYSTLVGEPLTSQKILDLKPTEQHYIYLSGPEPMVETLDKELKQAGINKKHIHTDFFPNYKDEFTK